MKNEYSIIGNEVIIYLPKRNGETIETIMDIEDFNKIKELDCDLQADLDKYNKYKLSAILKGEDKNQKISLAKLIMEVKEEGKKFFVRHIDGNYLNNKRNNLYIDKGGFQNKYIICENLTTIFVKQRSGIIHKILLDTKNLPIILKENLSWHVKWNVYTESYYPRAVRRTFTSEGIIQEMVYMYQLFIDYDTKTEEVDHINHDTLDTREENLRVTNKKLNDKNRSGKNKNNKSGYRNVFWSTSDNRWIVALQIEGKQTYFGRFKYDDLEKAGALAEEMRQKYYKEFAGAS